eukprot:363351-Chlamydomonas_euryale.AAC.1
MGVWSLVPSVTGQRRRGCRCWALFFNAGRCRGLGLGRHVPSITVARTTGCPRGSLVGSITCTYTRACAHKPPCVPHCRGRTLLVNRQLVDRYEHHLERLRVRQAQPPGQAGCGAGVEHVWAGVAEVCDVWIAPGARNWAANLKRNAKCGCAAPMPVVRSSSQSNPYSVIGGRTDHQSSS